MDLPDPLLRTFELVAAAMAAARHDWWIIASAACQLHGIDPGPVRDVDVLFDVRDVSAVLEPLDSSRSKDKAMGASARAISSVGIRHR